MKRALLDTDIVSHFLKGNTLLIAKIRDYVREHEFLNISIITYYEILNGLLYKDARKQLDRFLLFVENNNVVPLTIQSANISANIQATLRAARLEIGHPDTLIAGTAIANNMQLITNNISHFSRINGLDVANWL